MEDLVYMVGSQSLLYCIIMEYEILMEASWYSPYKSQNLRPVGFWVWDQSISFNDQIHRSCRWGIWINGDLFVEDQNENATSWCSFYLII